MYLQRTKEEILRSSLHKLAERTTITATSPGSVARILVELLADDLGDFYSTLDFNLKQAALPTATGRSLDLIGSLYNVTRKSLTPTAAEAAVVGNFYFYAEAPVPSDITIPRGTLVGYAENNVVARQYTFTTTADVVLRQGRMRVYAPISSRVSDSVYTAAPKTLVSHNFESPPGIIIRCTNPKEITPQVGYETDNDYRNRIISESRRQVGGTDLALRMTALGIGGVRNVQVVNGPRGLGTVDVVVSSEDYRLNDVLLPAIKDTLDNIKPVGISLRVRAPDLLELDVNATISVKRGFSDQGTGVVQRTRAAILRYINTLSVGDPLVFSQMTTEVMSTMDELYDITFHELSIDGSPIARKNFIPELDQHIVPGTVSVQVA